MLTSHVVIHIICILVHGSIEALLTREKGKCLVLQNVNLKGSWGGKGPQLGLQYNP